MFSRCAFKWFFFEIDCMVSKELAGRRFQKGRRLPRATFILVYVVCLVKYNSGWVPPRHLLVLYDLSRAHLSQPRISPLRLRVAV